MFAELFIIYFVWPYFPEARSCKLTIRTKKEQLRYI